MPEISNLIVLKHPRLATFMGKCCWFLTTSCPSTSYQDNPTKQDGTQPDIIKFTFIFIFLSYPSNNSCKVSKSCMSALPDAISHHRHGRGNSLTGLHPNCLGVAYWDTKQDKSNTVLGANNNRASIGLTYGIVQAKCVQYCCLFATTIHTIPDFSHMSREGTQPLATACLICLQQKCIPPTVPTFSLMIVLGILFLVSTFAYTYAFTFCLQKGRRILHRCTITSIHVSYRLTASNRPQQSLTLRKTNGIIPVMIPDSHYVPKNCLLRKRKVINTMYKVCKLRETTIWIWPLCPINQKWA